MTGVRKTHFPGSKRLLRNGNVDEAFDQLIERFRQDKEYRRVFDAKLMKKRLELNLPLVSQPTLAELPNDVQQAYQDASGDDCA